MSNFWTVLVVVDILITSSFPFFCGCLTLVTTTQEWRHTPWPDRRWHLPRHFRAPCCSLCFYRWRSNHARRRYSCALRYSLGLGGAVACDGVVLTRISSWPLFPLGPTHGLRCSLCVGTTCVRRPARSHNPALRETARRLCWWCLGVLWHDTHRVRAYCKALLFTWGTRLGAQSGRISSCGRCSEVRLFALFRAFHNFYTAILCWFFPRSLRQRQRLTWCQQLKKATWRPYRSAFQKRPTLTLKRCVPGLLVM